MMCETAELDRKVEASSDDGIRYKLETRLYKRRWFILLLFVLYSTANSIQWIEYSIITNIVEKYYNVTSYTVDWTSLITMLNYPIFLLPASYVIDKMGLRTSSIVAVLFTVVGSWIKVFSVKPDLFWVTFLGQFIVFIVQSFILSVPPKLASVWFADDEASRACGIGALGYQIGTALAFIVPPLVVKNDEDINVIGEGMSYLFYGIAIFSTAVAVLVITFFRTKPKYPPTQARALEESKPNTYTIAHLFDSYKVLFKNKPFMLHALCYSTNLGVFAGLCAILNQVILSYFEDSAEDAGLIGLLMILVGMIGSVIFGYILDKTRKYKEVTVGVYLMTVLSLLAFMFSLGTYSKPLIYISGSILGLFMNSYYAVGLEFAVELTYPSPEASSSGILLAGGQSIGVLLVLASGRILHGLGAFWALAVMAATLLLGVILTALTPNVLRRQAAFANAKECELLKINLQ